MTDNDMNDIIPVSGEIVPENQDIQKVYEYTRANLYSLIEKGQEAINGIMELAGEGGSPRAYEVAGQLIKSVADTTDKLADLQKKIKDLDSNFLDKIFKTNVYSVFWGCKIAAKFLSENLNLEVIVVDLRNHGSSFWSDNHDYLSMARDLIELCKNCSKKSSPNT